MPMIYSLYARFNPRAPHGARPCGRRHPPGRCAVSIHAPRTGRDGEQWRDKETGAQFQSTRPARGATRPGGGDGRRHRGVSIHAPRTGRDANRTRKSPASYCFNPRAPHGARHGPRHTPGSRNRFNPRAPHGARPAGELVSGPHRVVSIHAPRTGRDLNAVGVPSSDIVFQSTRPARGATAALRIRPWRRSRFNPRAPHGARLERRCPRRLGCGGFNPRAPHGARLYKRNLLILIRKQNGLR